VSQVALAGAFPPGCELRLVVALQLWQPYTIETTQDQTVPCAFRLPSSTR
jgi:hypothetical protein